MLVSFVFSDNQKPFVICTRVTKELHSFLSQSELSNFFVYLIKDIKNIRPSPHLSKPARADAFFGSLKKASIFVELVFRLQI